VQIIKYLSALINREDDDMTLNEAIRQLLGSHSSLRDWNRDKQAERFSEIDKARFAENAKREADNTYFTMDRLRAMTVTELANFIAE
jgi:hypothetical protein